jgi:phage terminase Nu1 subunit (DNA packaging protein)
MSDQVDIKGLVYLTKYQAACLIGLSYGRLTQLLNEPDPPPREADGTFRTDLLGQWIYRRGVKSVTGTGKPGPRPKSFMDDENDESTVMVFNPIQERARKDKELADKTALENQLRRGELVEAATVRKTWVDTMLLVKSRLLRLPFSVAPLIVGQEDQWKVQVVLDEQIRDALSELATANED